MRQLMRDDRLHGAKIRLDGDKVATAPIDVHAAAGGELSVLWVVVRDIPVVGLVFVEDDQDIVAPLGRRSNPVQHADDSLHRLVDEGKRRIGNVDRQS